MSRSSCASLSCGVAAQKIARQFIVALQSLLGTIARSLTDLIGRRAGFTRRNGNVELLINCWLIVERLVGLDINLARQPRVARWIKGRIIPPFDTLSAVERGRIFARAVNVLRSHDAKLLDAQDADTGHG